ncbi:hypothetical protein [Stenotrophomonas indicatrix]|uniref:hypothetical protein n=1 Tax=Stenotrophomonas indicatrix TaxID=2045451 RepID=UPI0028B25A3F|nr:hypothetical protein [Stenotrophomonas indicatrix]
MSNIIAAHNGYAGWYKIEAFRADAEGGEVPGSRRTLADWFPNLITNAGLDLFGTTGGTLVNEYCRVGSGNTAPAPTDTALVAQIAVSNTVQSDTNGVNRTGTYYGWRRRVIRFAAGSLGSSAANIAEVGVSPAASTALFSRALILDGGGVPTTISVQPDEVLDVTYELRVYPTLADASGSVVIAGVTYAWTARPITDPYYDSRWADVGYGIEFNTTLGNRLAYGPVAMAVIPPQNSQPVSPVIATQTVAQTYTNGSYQRSYRIDMDENDANVAGGIGALFACSGQQQSGGAWAWGLSPKLPKTAAFKATLTVRQSWGRYTP